MVIDIAIDTLCHHGCNARDTFSTCTRPDDRDREPLHKTPATTSVAFGRRYAACSSFNIGDVHHNYGFAFNRAARAFDGSAAHNHQPAK